MKRSPFHQMQTTAKVVSLLAITMAAVTAVPGAGAQAPLTPAGPALAASGALGGWVVVDQPVGGPASPANQYNSTGGANTVVRSGVGSYAIRFKGLAATLDAGIPGSAGVAHVTPFGTIAAHCAVKSYGPSATDEVVDVRCVRVSNGAPVDTPVSVTFARPGHKSTPGFQGFVLADQPSAKGTYTAANATSLNLVNGAVAGRPEVERVGIGRYFVTFPGAQTGRPDVGHIVITSLVGAAEACQLAPSSLVPPHVVIGVRCYDGAGALANAAFALSVVSRAPLAPATAGTYGYHFNTTVTQSRAFNWVAATQYAGPAYHTVDVPAPTALSVLLPGAAPDDKPGAVHTVAYESADYRHCQPRSWRRQLRDVVINIDCVNAAGQPVYYIGNHLAQPVAVSYQSQKGV